jgi:chitodextrinase
MTFNRKLTCEALEDRCMLAAFQSDDFNSLAINGSLWNAVDPLGDASFTTNGTHLRISVATGTAHDPATGSNTSPRIMQTIDNTDFEIAVKFDTSPIAGAYSGILVQQDIDDYLRYEFRRDTAGLTTWAFDSRSGVAIPAGNAAVVDSQSLYLRVTRSGNQWTHAFSTNGTAWTVVDTLTRSMNVASAGLFVGNAAGLGTPYYETSIDYAFETASPIVPEDGNLAIVPPTIDLWYGKDYAFGVLGNPQRWVNLLGNVSDPDGVTSLAYSLNAGASQPLSMGPNSTRLVNPGDFNVEIDRSLLATGWNTVVVTATDSLGNQSSESIYVNYTDNNVWPHAYTAQWGNVSKISAGGDIVDGRWELTAQGVRAVQPGYDRVIALGNQYLSDYEVQVPITMNQFNSGDSALGIAVRWKGHYEDPFQPNVAWWPLGGIGWFRFNGLEIIGNGGALIDRLETFSMNVGVTYIFRMRVESNPGSTATYSLKVWEQGTAEPTNWMVSGSGIAGELDAGSVLLLTHRFDATFGDVTITPITDGVLPTINANGTPFSNHITVDASASEPVTWEVNYGLTPSYELGTKRVAVPTASASLPLTGLAPQTTYHVRVVGTDTSGEASAPTSLILQTTAVDNTPPVLSNVQPTAQSTSIAVAATTNELATLQIRYGLTPSYELGTTAPSALATNHNLNVTALTSQTTYYLQVVATDPSGNSSTQNLVVATTAPNAGTSDQFDGTTLNTALWNFVNPQNDGTVSVNNGRLNLSVPAGVAHDVWTTGIAAPHVLQTISNTDFAIEVKFDSLPVGAYAMQGLLVKASNGDLLRFDFYSPSNTGLRIFAASFTGSSVNVRGNLNITPPAAGQPLYMRLSRVGNLWTQQYSYDGAAWTTAASFSYTLPVNAVGLFAGNAGPSPAYTAKVDWFQTGPDTTAPVISNLQTSAQGTSILTTATTNELATWRIRYGLTPSYELGTVGPTALATSHNLSVNSLNPQTTYYLQVVATDAAGNSSTQDLVVATTAVDTTPPVLSNVQPTAQSTSIAVAATTNELATLQIRYGLTPSYELGTTAPSALATNHNLNVTALTSQTTYYLQVVATDPSGNSSTQNLVVATTAPNAGTSDQFDGTTLNTALWNFVNPQNDGTVSVNNGRLNLSVPAGVAHDVWTTGIAAPHVLQTISNTDFAIEVKFDSLPVGAYAMQGLLVKASNGDLLRFDFYSPSNTGLRIFAASFTGSSVNVRGNLNITPPAAGQPLYMRLSRVGNLWTQQYSYDGAAWTTAASFSYTLPVNAVGLFAGNAGPSPAYTAKVDWFVTSTA